MASPSSSPNYLKSQTDGLTIPEEQIEQHAGSQSNFSQPFSVEENGQQLLPRTHECERPAEEGWARKLSGDEEKAAGCVQSDVEVVENLVLTAEKALEEADHRLDEAEALTENVLISATAGGGIVVEVPETAEVIVEGVETVSKAILLDADRLQSLLEQSETPKEKPEEESDADELLTSVEQKVTQKANNISRDGEPPKKKPKQEEEGGESS